MASEPDASNRWGERQLGSHPAEWKDRQCLKGMAQPVGGEGAGQREGGGSEDLEGSPNVS